MKQKVTADWGISIRLILLANRFNESRNKTLRERESLSPTSATVCYLRPGRAFCDPSDTWRSSVWSSACDRSCEPAAKIDRWTRWDRTGCPGEWWTAIDKKSGMRLLDRRIGLFDSLQCIQIVWYNAQCANISKNKILKIFRLTSYQLLIWMTVDSTRFNTAFTVEFWPEAIIGTCTSGSSTSWITKKKVWRPF